MSKIKEEEVSAMAAALTLSTTTATSQKRTRYILAGEIRQTFSFRDTIMSYIAKNPSTPKVYQKSIQCCKYFFNKNPILVIDELHYVQTGDYTDEFEWKVVLKELNPGIKLSDSDESNNESEESDTLKSNVDKAEKIDMDAVTCKFWITNEVSVESWKSYQLRAATSIIPKIYRCDASSISLTHQAITLNDFLLLASNAKYFKHFSFVIITQSDGKTKVPFEKIIERLPKIRYINWYCGSSHPQKIFSSNTVQELIKLPNFAQITSLSLHSLPEVFNAKELFDYVKNKNKNMGLDLQYDAYEYSDEMEQKIDEIVDEVLSTQTFTYKPPLMYYEGMDGGKYRQMYEIHNRYRNTRF